MRINNPWTGSAGINNYLKKSEIFTEPWQLRWKPVCASTEIELNKWLFEKPLSGKYPRAVVSSRQRKGKGQFGRDWYSLQGGVWLSAAFQFAKTPKTMELFGLAAAFALVQKLESCGVSVKIKWPNDLIVLERKIAGFLPRLIYRGDSLQFARLGIGLNVWNRAPIGAISLNEVLNIGSHATTKWAAEIILSIHRTKALLDETEFLCNEVQKRLWNKEFIDKANGELWKVNGITNSGKLHLIRGTQEKIIARW